MLFVTRQMQRTCCTKIGSNELQGDSAKKFLFSATHLDDCVIPVTAAVSRASLLKPPLFRPKHSLCSAFHSHLWLKLNPIFMTFWGLTLLWHSGGTVACIRPSGSLAWLSYQLGRGKCCTKIGSKSSFCSMAWCLVLRSTRPMCCLCRAWPPSIQAHSLVTWTHSPTLGWRNRGNLFQTSGFTKLKSPSSQSPSPSWCTAPSRASSSGNLRQIYNILRDVFWKYIKLENLI